jgi:membrane protease YdiL (CAAX protease family)
VVFVFVGLLEELVFRGVIQGALEPLLGAWSVAAADLLFAATYLDSGSAAYTLGMAAFGLACGWWVRRTRSVAGAAVAHGLVGVLLLVSLGVS